MSSYLDLPANVPVMCISRVYPNISESRIRRIFDDLNMGTIDRIDMVSKQNDKGEKFNRVFIHFQRWHNTENGRVTRDRLLNGKEIKIIYDDPWFWKISAYREPEHPHQHKQQHRSKPTIQIDSDDDERPRPQPQYRDERPRDERPRPQYHDERPRPQYRDERPRPQYRDERPRDERPRPQYRDERPRDERPRPQYRDERPRHQYRDGSQIGYDDDIQAKPRTLDNDLPTQEQEIHAVNYNVDPRTPPVKRKRNLNSDSRGKPLKIEDLEENSTNELKDGKA